MRSTQPGRRADEPDSTCDRLASLGESNDSRRELGCRYYCKHPHKATILLLYANIELMEPQVLYWNYSRQRYISRPEGDDIELYQLRHILSNTALLVPRSRVTMFPTDCLQYSWKETWSYSKPARQQRILCRKRDIQISRETLGLQFRPGLAAPGSATIS